MDTLELVSLADIRVKECRPLTNKERTEHYAKTGKIGHPQDRQANPLYAVTLTADIDGQRRQMSAVLCHHDIDAASTPEVLAGQFLGPLHYTAMIVEEVGTVEEYVRQARRQLLSAAEMNEYRKWWKEQQSRMRKLYRFLGKELYDAYVFPAGLKAAEKMTAHNAP